MGSPINVNSPDYSTSSSTHGPSPLKLPGDFNSGEQRRASNFNRNSNPEEPIPSCFEEFQVLGWRRQEWIEDPSGPCPILPSYLTAQDLWDQGWTIQEREPNLEWLDVNELRELDVPQVHTDPNGRLEHFNYGCENWQGPGASWMGYTGPGIVYMTSIDRLPNSPTPSIAAITKVVYERTFDINSLKHVVFENVVNRQTRAFVLQLLYSTERLGYTWYNNPHENSAWERGIPEYEAFLGTRMGKIVSYLVLSSFRRGTKYIERAVTHRTPHTTMINIRFEIGSVEVQNEQGLRRSPRTYTCLRCLRDGCTGCYVF